MCFADQRKRRPRRDLDAYDQRIQDRLRPKFFDYLR